MRPLGLRTAVTVPSAAEHHDRLKETLDQLERAELYVAAALDLQAEDAWRWRLVEDLRAQLVAVRRSLARPRVTGQDHGAAADRDRPSRPRPQGFSR
jgi:hypothetical protein